MSSNLPAIQNEAALMPSQSEWALMRDMAAALLPTGFLPESLKKPEQVVAVMLKGRELRVPPMYALSNIVIVKGKPTASAELMLALIQRDFGQRAIRVKESDDTHCTVEYRQEGWPGTQSYTFTIEQAAKAGLAGSQTWKSYPAAMLRARCISAVARMAFPGSIGGMYVPGELGDAVTVDDDGEVRSVNVVPVVVDAEGVIQDAPQTREIAPSAIEAPAEVSDNLATQRQRQMIEERWAALGQDKRKLNAYATKRFSASMLDLDREQAADFITFLDQQITAMTPAGVNPQPSEPSAALLAEAAAEPSGMDAEDYAQVVADIAAAEAYERAHAGTAGDDIHTR